jgi:hypothetical protein
MDGLLERAPLVDFCDPQIASLISLMLSLVDTPQQLEVISSGASRAITNHEGCCSHFYFEEISAAFERLLKVTPEWLLPVKEAGAHQWQAIISEMNHVILFRRACANGNRSLLFWGERGTAVVRDAMGNQEGPYSCSAAWAL